ncbi:hypothetical protein [Nesterenkonia suensis]
MTSRLTPEDAANIWIAAQDLANAALSAARVTELEAQGVPPVDEDDAEKRAQVHMSYEANRHRLHATIAQHVTEKGANQ